MSARKKSTRGEHWKVEIPYVSPELVDIPIPPFEPYPDWVAFNPEPDLTLKERILKWLKL
jgi:hypothetical protein